MLKIAKHFDKSSNIRLLKKNDEMTFNDSQAIYK